jgi:hypothetical protein
MVGLSLSRTLRACAALAFAGAFFTAPVLADTVTLSPATYNAGRDGSGTSSPRDGQFDALLPALNINVGLSSNGTAETRALYEFVLPSQLMVPGTVINSANLTLTVNLETLGGGNAEMVLHGYLANDAVVTVDDFEVTNPVSQLTLWSGGGGVGTTRTYNIPYWLQTLPGGSNPRIGLLVATNTAGTSLRYNGQSAQLTIDYTPPVGTPPDLQILSPSNNAVYVLGDYISFQGTAFDNEDGDRSWGITWSSNIAGEIAWGGSSMTNSLGVGSHVITATVYDYDGNVSIKTRNITVVAVANQPPAVTISSPANGVTVNSDALVNFTATAADPEQGSLTSNIQWFLNGNTQIGSTGSLTTTIPAGTHTVTARVTDSGGLTGENTITVNSVAPPPPITWCATQPTDGSSYWLQSMQFNAINFPSGPNGGFGDYSATTVAGFKGATNTITLTPGSAGGTATLWYSVWIDLNNDFVFSASDLVVQDLATGLAPITRGFLVSAGWPPGPRRMRVAVHTNAPSPACGIFPAGEVEDYTINLQSPPTPPPPPPSAYCASRSSSSTWEYIRGTTIAGVPRTSNNNGGYADFTTSPAINLARGSNAITLTPGFGSGTYTESWRVWVDLNANSVFESNESLYTGASSAALNGQIVIPSTALAGNTRLRVQMKYGGSPTQCESFSYGEVEDYLVNIAP